MLAASGIGALGRVGNMTGASTAIRAGSMGGLQQGFLAQLGRANLLGIGAALGRGDKSRSWRSPLTARFDGIFAKWATRISGISPLFANILADANYLRAMVGSISIITYPIAVATGFFASASVHHHALPPTIFLMIATMFLGMLDAFAGFIAYSVFILSIALAGNISSLHDLLTLAGVSLIGYSPILLAGEFRPMRRQLSDGNSIWERATDYVLASVLTGWVVQKMVEGLPGLSGLALPIATHGRVIGIWAGIFVIARFAAEDAAFYLYPSRLNSITPEYKIRTTFQNVGTMLVKIALFSIVAEQFIGMNLGLGIGIGMFALPMLLSFFEHHFPKTKKIAQWLPKGALEIVVMTTFGTAFAFYLQGHLHDSATFVVLAFVLLGIPGLFISILNLFSDENSISTRWRESKVGNIFYRTSGVVVLVGLVYTVFGGDILKFLH